MNFKKIKEGAFLDTIIIDNIKDFNLQQTLECGQCFRWDMVKENSYNGVVLNKAVNATLNNGALTITGCCHSHKDFWLDYFDLKADYGKIRHDLSLIHPTLKEAATYAPGIRILNQDKWEALCSFIISQNNNIPRIKGIISRLCGEFGNKISDNAYTFPTPQELKNVTIDDLQPLRSGFRAKYIVDAVEKVNSGEVCLDRITTLPLPEAREQLIKIKGVGVKVADCTLLYGMHRLECFPIDVWMRRAMEVLFPNVAPEDFGQYAGIAQQYIFHYSRMNPTLFEEK
ncbi:MAG TPA: DNA glycosylase [Clostridiales bacterium]|nr:DNA glycosylase [Clostridiales bacterium]